MVSCDDGNIHFINMNVLKLEKSVQFGKISIWDFQVINNGKYLLMGCSDGNVRLWEIGTKNRAIMKHIILTYDVLKHIIGVAKCDK